jgi:UDP-N-acetylmuramoyl-L-alanyl-D-glutamate--2,6-diaminopimelate ligase
MKLRELASRFPEVRVEGDADCSVSGVADDSRAAEPGDLFAAVRGAAHNGEDYAGDAVARGAVAVLAERDLEDCGARARLIVPDARRALSHAAEALAGDPSARLELVGVTGTNGKTTTATLVQHLLGATGRRCGLIGTIEIDTARARRTASMTTPGSVELSALLAEMVGEGCTACAMEASSHALEQQRTAGLRFAAGIFTNLTRDHLDYHGSMEAYGASKARLFSALAPGALAVLNAEDPFCASLAEGTRARTLFYGSTPEADLRIRPESLTSEGSRLRVAWEGREERCESPLIGAYNVLNLGGALGAALGLGVAFDEALAAAEAFPGVRGRLERVPVPGGRFSVFIDYAHTDDALRNVLAVLKPLTRGRLVAVFGCGGDRDRGKRPLMARAVEACADRIVLTSDNPRSEDPDAILDDVEAGFAHPERVERVRDRREAVARAVAGAGEGDVILVAGKGHEDYQELACGRIHLDDRELVRDALGERAGSEGSAA